MTKEELEKKLSLIEESNVSLQDALTRANVTIATCVLIAEGGTVEIDTRSDTFYGPPVQRCLDARAAAQVAQKDLGDKTQKRFEEEAEFRHSQARQIRRLASELKRRRAAIDMVKRVTVRAAEVPFNSVPPEVDAALAGLFISDIGSEE